MLSTVHTDNSPALIILLLQYQAKEREDRVIKPHMEASHCRLQKLQENLEMGNLMTRLLLTWSALCSSAMQTLRNARVAIRVRAGDHF